MPLKAYNMAEKGVNTTKSPIHLEDNEVTAAQNFQTDPTLADGAIRRRDGMAKLNSSALAGAVKGMIALPFPDNFTVTRTFYQAFDDATTNTWRTSTTGAAGSWATITDATLRKAKRSALQTGIAGIFDNAMRGAVAWASFNHKIYFPGDDYTIADLVTDTSPTLYSWDGTTAVKLLVVPPPPQAYPLPALAITSITPYSKTELLIGVAGRTLSPANVYGSLLLYDTITGTMEQLGPATEFKNLIITAPYVFQGRIWVAPGYANLGSGTTLNVSWIRPGDSDWTTDAAFAATDIGGVNMVEFLGNLYLGTHSGLGTNAATIRKRTTSTGVWSTVLSTDGTGTQSYLGPLIVTADGLTILAYFNNGNGTAPITRIVSSTDGASWVTALDIPTDTGANKEVAGIPYLDSDGSIYWYIKSQSGNVGVTKKRTSAGSWSTVDSTNALRGPIQALKVVT